MMRTPVPPASRSPLVNWAPSQEAANQRLQHFLPNAGASYAQRRNFDLGPADRGNVSALSPWLRHRALLETEVLRAVLHNHTRSSAEKFVQEVLWRGYFKGWLEHYPDVWTRYTSRLGELADQLDQDRSLARRYADAVHGKTGFDCFDAWASELVEVGYLHNHARMWFASIWVYTLRLPWELGADFFLRHLLDADPASNTCSWRWVGGLHTKGKTYLARAENIETFTEGRFRLDGDFATLAPPLDEPELPSPIPIAPTQAQPQEGRVGLIVTEEDCSPESLPLRRTPTAVLVLRTPTKRSLWPMGDIAHSFVSGVLADAAARAETAFSVPVEVGDDDQWTKVIADWSKAHELDAAVTARLTIGPVRTRLLKAMEGYGLPLVEVVRPYDEIVWPHTKRGFFALKKQTPSILVQLEGGRGEFAPTSGLLL